MRLVCTYPAPLRFCFITVMFLFTSAAYGQTLNSNWRQELSSSLDKFLNCSGSPENPSKCHSFIGESLQKVYKINDFYSQRSRRYMTASEISTFLKDSDKWTMLGHSYEQKTLMTAQEHANDKKAVVAVYMNGSGLGHVVLITPGELQISGSWGLNVPSAASFFPPEPTKSFVDKGLSFAFPKNVMKDVLLYAREY